MYIHSLKLQNFLSYKDFYKEFSPDEVVSITGDNMSGKSTIIDAIDFALTGNRRAPKETDMIHYGEEVMFVELVIDDGGEKRLIRRGRTAANSGQLRFDKIDKIAESQEAINSLLKMDAAEFHMTCFFKHVNISMFMELPPKERKEYMMRWMKNDHWSRLYTSARHRTVKLKSSVDEAMAKTKVLNLNTKALPLTDKDIKRIRKERDALVSLIQELENGLERAIAGQAKNEAKSRELSKAIRLLDTKIEKRETLYARAKSSSAKLPKLEIKSRKLGTKLKDLNYKNVKDDIRKYISAKAQAEQVISDVKTRQKEAKRKMTGECPFTGMGCSKALFTKKVGATYDKEILKNTKIVDKMSKLIDAYDQGVIISDDKLTVDGKIDALMDINLVAMDKELTKLRAKRAETKETLRILSRKLDNNRIDTIKRKYKDSSRLLEEKRAALKEQEDTRLHNKRIKEQIGKLKNRIARWNKRKEYDTILMSAFCPSGIPSMEIENNFAEIEDEANIILSSLDDTIEIIFTPDKELSYWEKSCGECGFIFPKNYRKSVCKECNDPRRKARKDELNIAVLENGEERHFTSLSSGGKTMVSLSLRVALMRFLGRQYGCELKTLFFDEVDGPLDDTHIRKINKLVSDVLIKKMGYEQIFWVSHSDIVKGAATSGIRVTKEDDCSEVEFWEN